MNKEEIISTGLLEMYVIGAASPEEIIQVEAMRRQYPELEAEILNIEIAIESYAMANAVAPSAQVKDRILSQINNPTVSAQTTGKTVTMSPFWRIAAAASVLLLLVSNIFYYIKYQDANSKYQNGQQEIAAINSKYAEDQQKINDMNRDMSIVQSKYSEPVALHGMEATPEASAKIFWMKNTGEVYVDPINMPMAPKGMQYQLWAIVDGKPVDGGLITSKDGKIYKIQKMKTFGKAQAFAITLETQGGNPTPKGTMYVKGEI